MSEVKVSHVSASSIASFKACPVRYRLGYVEALRPIEDAAPLRMGAAWHTGLEVLEAPAGQFAHPDGEVTITDKNRLEIAIMLATSVYQTIPDGMDPTDWAVEREVIANGLAAYAWLYAESHDFETVANELEFELPLVNPETGHATPNFVRVGRIDRIVKSKLTGALLVREDKSTSRPIDSGSTYWNRLHKDTQSKFYILAARDLKLGRPGSQLPDLHVSGLLHCVFRKPSISPKKLTQGESLGFVTCGDYCGQHFEFRVENDLSRTVDGVVAEVEPGKKEGTFALRETPAMYGARLFQDMTTVGDDFHGPDWYFARKEVAFTDDEMIDFAYQVWALQRTMAEMTRTGHWYENEAMCEAVGSFKCPFCPICYNNVDVFHGATPPGFKRIRGEEAEKTATGGSE